MSLKTTDFTDDEILEEPDPTKELGVASDEQAARECYLRLEGKLMPIRASRKMIARYLNLSRQGY